ncbi:MAG: SDR family NAD(P)-dependent oxidoreductase [Acidobacteria bacterium]|nr:MAG: SDR family NAD(P)-dependent oxidoreductase [Acidobacteriota bacterium]
MGSLAGRTAFVTGASSGIGAATARALAGAGARLVLCARRVERVEELARAIEADGGGPCRVLALDVRDRDAVRAAVDGLAGTGFEAIDILVNNAGLAAGLDPLQEGDFGNWDRMLDTNVKGLLNVTRLVVPGMIARGGGHVVNIGSIAGREVYPAGNVYCASKHAVRALNRALRIDTLGKNIRVTSVDPGLVETEFALVRFDGDADRAKAVYRGMQPLTAADVADAVLWAVTRPAHVNVEEILLMPTDQASSVHVHRRGGGA